MNKKIVFSSIISMILLIGCSPAGNSSNNSVDSSESSTTNSSNEEHPTESSSHQTSQESSETSSKLPSSSSSNTTNQSKGTLTREEANEALIFSALADDDFTEVRTSQYNNYATYRQRRDTKMSKYLDATIHVGTTINYNANNVAYATANFREERAYSNSFYTQIRKFENTFLATAYRYEMEEDEALMYLNVGQGFTAYLVFNEFINNYNGVYFGEVLEDGSRHVSFVHSGEVDSQEYQFLAGFEFTMDNQYHMTDFWYTEGYYDTIWNNYNTPTSMRKHGVYGEGYSYYMDSCKLGKLTEYPLELQYNIEDNFIREISFTEESLTLSISETEEDEYGYKTINLLELLLTDPQIGDLIKGCPINNLTFTSSNPDVIQVNDGWYADFVGVGETTITVFDSAFSVTGSNTLKITLLD